MLIIQARMGSERLPGKVLLPLGDTTIIGSVIRGCKDSGELIVVAIPDTPENDILEQEILSHDVEVFRGSEDDVLDRFFQCALIYEPHHIIRITADCPLISNEIIRLVNKAGYLTDYTSNVLNRTFPKGLDCEYFSYEMLARAHKKAVDPYDREHVTPWIKRTAKSVGELRLEVDLSYINLSVDTMEDYRRICDLDKMRSQ